MQTERLLTLASLVLSLACGTNDNTVASRPGTGGAGGTDSAGGSGAAGVSGASNGGVGGVSQGGASGRGGTVASGGSADNGGGSATGGSAGEDGGATATGGMNEGGAPSGGGGAGGGGAMGGASGAGGDWSSPCEDNLDCVVRAASCCGMCGVATRDDVIAINREQGEAYHQEVCGNVVCPPCAGQPDPTLMAACIGGFCTVVDILTHDVTACSSAADCRVRASACCECGADLDPDTLIAINPNSPTRYGELACNVDSVCAGCVPQYPPATIDCLANHCQIVPE